MYTLDYVDAEELGEDPKSQPLADSVGDTHTGANPGNQQQSREEDWVLASKKWIHEALLVNIQVYAAAEKYDISELKDFAHQKAKKRLGYVKWPYYKFHDAVLETIRTIPANDKGLRETIAETCANAVDVRVFGALLPPSRFPKRNKTYLGDCLFARYVLHATLTREWKC